MSSDTPEIREDLNTAWKAVSVRLVQCGFSRSAVVETMIGSALRELDELYGTLDSAHRLLVLAKTQWQQSNGHDANGIAPRQFERRATASPGVARPEERDAGD